MKTLEKLLLVKQMITQLIFYFKENFKIIAMYLKKQQAVDADLRVIRQIIFTANLDRARNTTMFFFIE